MKTVSLEIHDWSVIHNRMDVFRRLKEHYPDFRVSLFTIPYDYPFETSQNRLYRDRYLKEIHENLDWLQIIPHGLMHIDREFEKCDYHTMRDLIFDAIDENFKRDGLPYEKGFCAPYWLWNEDVVRALDEKGWWGAIDRNQPDMLKTKRSYTYSHSIDQPFWKSTEDTLKLHGHMAKPSSNNLDDCLLNLFKLPSDTRWVYVTTFIDESHGVETPDKG